MNKLETQLYEALNGLTDRYVEQTNSGDCGFWDPEKESEVINARQALADAMRPQAPIPMILHCPTCGAQHIDKEESELDYQKRIGEFDKVGAYFEEPERQIPPPRWLNPVHRSHTCAACKTIWRPADVPTTGVEFIQTRGKVDNLIFVKQFINGTELVQPPTHTCGGYVVFPKSKRQERER